MAGNDRTANTDQAPCSAALDPNAMFNNIPDEWRVVWCPVCGYAVTFDDATCETYDQAEWLPVLEDAARHEHGGPMDLHDESGEFVATDTFTRTCQDCGGTINVVGGVEQPHDHT